MQKLIYNVMGWLFYGHDDRCGLVRHLYQQSKISYT